MSNVDKFRDYLKLLDEKEAKIKEFKDAVNSETSLKLELLHKSNDVKLHPNNVKEEYELSKAPTEKQIQAHIDETYKDLELLDNRISFEKYVLQLEMKQ